MPGKKGEIATADKEENLSVEKPTETTDKTEDNEETAVEDQDDAVENKQVEKRGRGRPKKSDGEPVAKTPKRDKKVKESTPPSRVSRRLSNQRTGKKLPEVVEEEKSLKKRNIKPKSPKKAEKNVEQSNEEVAETKDEDTKEEDSKEPEQSTNGTPEVAASS